ncbi:hypothetical protein chiPu_0021557, partial [Chiloscyllium punctatum]|nr:hypothetical protein [Chiloscyllium punctatum]
LAHSVTQPPVLLFVWQNREAENLYAGIQSNNYNVRSDSLKGLAVLSKDITFAQEFISKDGIAVLVRIVENGHDTGESLAYALNAFIELMEHGVVSWETLNHVFIKKIAGFVNKSAMDASIQQLSLAILESMEQRDMIHRLRQAAFESDADASAGNFNTDRRKSLCAREFKKLGFSNSANPSLDFSRTPPGLLPLDNMTYFAAHHADAYNR